MFFFYLFSFSQNLYHELNSYNTIIKIKIYRDLERTIKKIFCDKNSSTINSNFKEVKSYFDKKVSIIEKNNILYNCYFINYIYDFYRVFYKGYKNGSENISTVEELLSYIDSEINNILKKIYNEYNKIIDESEHPTIFENLSIFYNQLIENLKNNKKAKSKIPEYQKTYEYIKIPYKSNSILDGRYSLEFVSYQ